MSGSRTIHVLKRDRSVEPFDARKLAGALWRAMQSNPACRYSDAVDLSAAMEMYVRRTGCPCVSSAAVFEMAIKVLRRVGMVDVACSLERHWQRRARRRQRLHVLHDGGQTTLWDKSWLAGLACRTWNVSPTAGRIMAADVERRLLAGRHATITRQHVVDTLNKHMMELGLADAVPVM